MTDRYKIINGERIKLTDKENVERDAEEEAWADGAFNRAIASLRQDRNRLLAETDYLALSDQTLTVQMKKYRQDLRDITNGLTTVEQVKAVEFPEKP